LVRTVICRQKYLKMAIKEVIKEIST